MGGGLFAKKGWPQVRKLGFRPRGNFPKQENPNIDPKILYSLLGIPKKVSTILGNAHVFHKGGIAIRLAGSDLGSLKATGPPRVMR